MRRGPTVQVGRGGPGLIGTVAKTAVIAGTATVTAKAVSGAMGGGSAQKQEDRQEFGRGGTAVRYKMRDKIMSIGDDFWIENEQRQRVYKVDGKMLRIRDILKFEDAQGNVLVDMASKLIQLRDQVKLDRTGAPSAVVKKDLINIVRDHFLMTVDNGTAYDIKGNLLDHEYSFFKGRDKVAEVSKKWFRLTDTYGVQIEQGEDEILILAATVAVDQLSHDIR